MKRHRTILSEELTRKRIEESIYLRSIYREIYAQFFRLSGDNSELRVLEIGSGGTSFASEFWPNVTQTSYSWEGGMSAEKIEFPRNSFDLIISKDVLHHIKNVSNAFREFNRVLGSDGVVLASEPSWSLLGRLVYKFFHQEPWEVTEEFVLNSNNPWDSNQALIWNLLRVSDSRRRDILNGFELKIRESTYGLSYLLSGGVHSPTKIPPNILYRLHKRLGIITRKFDSIISLNRIVEFKKS